MAESDTRGGGAGGRLRVAQWWAGELEEPTRRIEQLAADFVSQLDRLSPGISYQIGVLEENPELLTTNSGAWHFADSIEQLAQVSKEALGQVEGFAAAVQPLGKVSNRLQPISRRMSAALRRIVSGSSVMQEWGQRINEINPGT